MKKKVGLALGAGAARGFIHIGVLKVLHKHNILPDFIAGTSMGAAIGALYGAGYSPNEIKDVAKTTKWKGVVDFTIPKSGLLKGELVEGKLRRILKNKTFDGLSLPLQVVSYNITKNKTVIFSKGDVARAVRASISIPGIFTPLVIDGDNYVDGMLGNPTPYDVVKRMGADIVIAVDLHNESGEISNIKLKRGSFFHQLKKKLILDELFNVKNYIFPKRWPHLLKKILDWFFDKIIFSKKVLKVIFRQEVPEVTKVMYHSFIALASNFAMERIKNAKIDILINPSFKNLRLSDFDKVDEFVKIGEKAMEEKMPELKRLLRKK
ncbi:MAG: patatin-like phospholipase family protein [archaeon]|nr:patatin-like phospholipase family protein [archaeon]